MPDYLAAQLERMPPHLALLRAVECRFMGAVSLAPPVLDVGCGDGNFARVAWPGATLDVGIDPSAKALQEAATLGVYRSLVQVGAERLPFADGIFGTVVSNSVLEHIPDLPAALAEIRRVLKPGGRLATTMPGERFPEYLLGSTVFRKLGWTGGAEGYGRFFNRISRHFHVYDESRWRREFETAGFVVERSVDYFSAAAHRRFDLSHYIGVPNLVARKLTGSWIAYPFQARVLEAWLRRFYEEPLPETGAYRFFLCRAA